MRPKVFICHPSGGGVNPYTHNSLLYNLWELGREGIDIEDPMAFEDYPLSRARNASVDHCLDETDCNLYFTYDDDQIFYKGTLLRLIMTEQPIINTWYLARKGNLGLVAFKRDKRKQLLNQEDFNHYAPLTLKELIDRQLPHLPGISQVDGIGLGGCLMTRDALIKLRETSEEYGVPIFAEWSPLMSKKVHQFGEDLWWSDVCAMAELPILVHLGCYVGHWGKQGFVLGPAHAQAKAMQEGLTDFNLREFMLVS